MQLLYVLECTNLFMASIVYTHVKDISLDILPDNSPKFSLVVPCPVFK